MDVVSILSSKGVNVLSFKLDYTVMSVLNFTMDVDMLSHFDKWQRLGHDNDYEAQDQWPVELRRARLIPAVDYIQMFSGTGEDVTNALTFAEYGKAQRTSAVKVNQMCKGVDKGQNFSSDFTVESSKLAPMFVPGPFAIAHHFITLWVHQSAIHNPDSLPKQLNNVSNL